MPPFRIAAPCTGIILLTAGCLLSSCGRPQRVEVVESRRPFDGEPVAKAGLSAQQRFAENEAQKLFAWEKPASWRNLAATEFRQINFDFGPKREGECYLTLLPVSRNGGLVENLNRWRTQMGAAALTPEQVQELPRRTILGKDVPFLDLTGTWNAPSGPMMQAGAPRPDWRMLGVILEAPGFLITVKMTGPAALVAQEAGAFESFCRSLAPVAGLAAAAR